MATLIGKVGMVMKGDWNSSTAYEVLDIVKYNGLGYVASQNVPAGTLPTNTTYWMPLVDPGLFTGSNRNLLDNPFFQINQRSVSSGSVLETSAYTVDRWKIARCASYNFNGDGSVTTAWDETGGGCYLIQYFLPQTASMIFNRTITFSIYVDDILHMKTLQAPGLNTNRQFSIGDITVNLNNVSSSGRGFELQIMHRSTTGKKIATPKIEMGSFSTVANDIAPDYYTELIKCATSTADSTDTYANKTVVFN